jgi:Prp8 binding protein
MYLHLNVRRQWDLRGNDPTIPVLSLTQQGVDTITGMALSPTGTHILANSMDSVLRAWDVRPFFQGSGFEDERCERRFEGHRHGAEKLLLKCSWSPDGERVACGSADRYDIEHRVYYMCVYYNCTLNYIGDMTYFYFNLFMFLFFRITHIWDTSSCKELYCLPGHKGSVNEVIFHPTEPIIASCGSDKQIFIGEL